MSNENVGTPIYYRRRPAAATAPAFYADSAGAARGTNNDLYKVYRVSLPSPAAYAAAYAARAAAGATFVNGSTRIEANGRVADLLGVVVADLGFARDVREGKEGAGRAARAAVAPDPETSAAALGADRLREILARLESAKGS